jgi:hypothetical protein
LAADTKMSGRHWVQPMQDDEDEAKAEALRSRWREPSGSVFLAVALIALILMLAAVWL